MLQRFKITSEQIDEILREQAIPEDIIGAGANVAVILTQSWCGQWRLMQGVLKRLEKKGPDIDLRVYELEYDRISQKPEFITFKEDVLGNHLIPFILYYKDGEKIGETNYIGRDKFTGMFESVDL